MSIDAESSRNAFGELARKFNMSLEEAADSAIRLSNANIVRAIQVISTERGYDPRDSVLVPYGGAGPLHAAEVAEELGITTVVVPPNAGVLSAYGLLASDFVQYENFTQRGILNTDAADEIRNVFYGMKKRAIKKARSFGLNGDLELSLVVEMRFVGQAFEVPVELPIDRIDSIDSEEIRTLFEDMHQKLFFFGADEGKPVEYVSFRLGVTAPLEFIPQLISEKEELFEKQGATFFSRGTWEDGVILSRAAMAASEVIEGPAVLEDSTSTILVPRGWKAEKDKFDNLVMTFVGEVNG